jgi:hypothetical protein
MARVHVVRVDGGSAARLRVVQAGDLVMGGRETTTSMCRRAGDCVAAVNGDFWTADGPVGGVVADGRLLRSPREDHEQLWVEPLRATTGGFGPAGWSGVVRAPAASRSTWTG